MFFKSIIQTMLSLALFGSLALLSSCGSAEAAEVEGTMETQVPSSTPKLRYPVTTVSVEDISRAVKISGRVIPLQEASISSKVPGLVLPTNKLLQIGKYYRKGEVMVSIDDEQLRYGLRAERAALLSSLTQLLPDLSIDYAAEYDRWETYINEFSVDQFLKTLPQIDDDQLRHFINARGILVKYYAIKAQEITLDDYQITAPFSGYVTMANVEAGSYVQPGSSLAKISRNDVYEVLAEVPNALLSQLSIGKKVVIELASTGQEYEATVQRFGPNVDAATQTIPVYFRCQGKGLRSGLFTESTLQTPPLKAVTVLPKEAVSLTNEVYLIANDRIITKAVEVISIDADKAYVRGLAEGDQVIAVPIDPVLLGTEATTE